MALTDLIKKFGGVTESYWFYKDSDEPIELRYDPKDHVYLLVTPDGLEKQDGVTTVVHIIDKSSALIPWATKMMYQKVLRTFPYVDVEVDCADGTETRRYAQTMPYDDFNKLIHEAKDAHKEKLEEAGDIGHIAHAWIEDYIKLIIAGEGEHGAQYEHAQAVHLHMQKLNDPEQTNEKSASCCLAALDWMRKHKVKWISTERKIYSRKYKYAGTMDGLCRCTSCDNPLCCPEPFEDRLTVADWKTSNYLYLEYLFQTAAYEQAYEEETGEEVLDRWVIRLGKEDGEFEPWHVEEHNFADDFGGFVDALQLTRRVRRINERIRAKKADLRAAIKAERDAAKALKEEAEKVEKALAKEAKAAERLAAMRIACPLSKTYKGSRKPSCKVGIGAVPCEACTRIYTEAQAAKGKKVSNVGAFPHKEAPCVHTTSSCAKINPPLDLSLKTLGYKTDVDGEIFLPNEEAVCGNLTSVETSSEPVAVEQPQNAESTSLTQPLQQTPAEFVPFGLLMTPPTPFSNTSTATTVSASPTVTEPHGLLPACLRECEQM